MDKLILKRGHDVLTAENPNEGKPCVLLHVGYEDLESWCGMHLTQANVAKLYDWLGKWQKERLTGSNDPAS